MVEVRDPNSHAILFKRTEREKKVDDLEQRVQDLTSKLETLLSLQKQEKEN